MLNSTLVDPYQQQSFMNPGHQQNTSESVQEFQHFPSARTSVIKSEAVNLQLPKQSFTNTEFVAYPNNHNNHFVHEMHGEVQKNSPLLNVTNSSPVDSSALQNENTPTDDRNFSCHKCSKVFKRGDHLKRHLLSVHDHDNPYHCGECRKGFVTVDCLIKHTHTAHSDISVKAYVCTWCGLQFDDIAELDKHATAMHKTQDMEYIREINKSSRIFSCTMCNKNVSSEKTLKRHIKKAHRRADGKQLCLECNASFYSIRELQAHIDQFHKGTAMSIADEEMHSNVAKDTSPSTFISKNNSKGKLKAARTEESQPCRPKHGNNDVSLHQNQLSTHSENNYSSAQQNRQVKVLPQELEMHVQRVCSEEITSTSSIYPRPFIQSQFVKPLAVNRPLSFCTQEAKINSAASFRRDCMIRNAEQTKGEACAVSEVFSKAMRTLSDFSYDGLFLQTTDCASDNPTC